MSLSRSFRFAAATLLLLTPVTALGHGVAVNVDLNAAGTNLVTDRTVYADRDITAITAVDGSLHYQMDDDVPGFEFSSNLLLRGGVISLKVIGPTYFWNPASQLRATTSASVVLDSLFYYSPPAAGAGPLGESVAGQKSISSTLPVRLYDPSSPPGTDHHYAAYNLTTGAGKTDPPVGAYGLLVELVDQTTSSTITSKPFMIGLDNGLTHSVSSFGAEGSGDHQQPAADGTDYGSAVAAFEAQMANTAVWNLNQDGSYGVTANWDGNPLQGAANAGTTVTLGKGSTTAINVLSATVKVDGPYTAGALVFDSVGGTNYTLTGDGTVGHGLTLNNNGAGASINVLGGSHTISTNLTFAEATVFNVASGGSLLITGGQIGELVTSTPIYLTGGGTLTIDSASTYSGPTMINGGTLRTTPRGSISAGPLALNTDNYIASSVFLANSQTLSSLSVTGDDSGSATVGVASGQTLSVQQPLALDANTALRLTEDGKLRFAATSGSATAGPGATVTVASGATLELAGSVSALSSDINVFDNSGEASGGALVVSGTNQRIGNVDGSGDLVIDAGGDLTTNHINLNTLIIGGTSSAIAKLTIAESSSVMSPTDVASGSVLVFPTSDFANSGQTTVPEPPTLLLASIGLAVAALFGRRR